MEPKTKRDRKPNLNFQTVTRMLKVELPADFDDYLLGLGEKMGKSVESILLEELYCVSRGFFSSGFAGAWAEYLIRTDKNTHVLETQVSQIADKVLA